MRKFTRASVTISAVSLAAVTLAAPAAVAVPLSYPAVVDAGVTVNSPFPNYDIAVDCDAFTAQYAVDSLNFYAELYQVSGGTLTITFDCVLLDQSLTAPSASVAGGTAQTVVDAGTTTVTVDGNTSFRAFFVDSSAGFRVDFLATAALSSPTGSVLHEVTLPYAGDTALFAVGDEGKVYDCIEGEGMQPYMAQTFTVLTAGTYTFRFTGYTPYEGGLSNNGAPGSIGAPANPWGTPHPWYDPALVLYSSFDPADTEAGFIACNDDSDRIDQLQDDVFDYRGGARDASNRFLDDYFSELVITLQPGVYTLLTLPYDNPDVSIVSAEKPDALSPAYALDDIDQSGTVTTSVQYWGVDDGLVLGAQLAATGASTSTSAGLTALGALLSLTGVLLVVARRRRALSR